MAIVIDGTAGISGVDGSAGTPAVQGTDTNTGIYYSAADTVDVATGGVQRGQFDSSGNFKFNSGYGSVATAYGCRAWVNFNGSANTNLTGTYSQSGTTVTVTATAHGYIVGSIINADITSGTGVDGIYTVTAVTDANTFTYTAGTSLTTSGNVTLLRNTIRASGNVSSITDNGTGDYTVNFTTAMPDANYATLFGGQQDDTSQALFMGLRLTNDTGTGAVVTTTSVRLLSAQAGTATDIYWANVAIFR